MNLIVCNNVKLSKVDPIYVILLVSQIDTQLINPRRMCEGYGSRFVCVSVCLSVTALAATYLVCMSKLRHHRVPCRLLKVFIAWISLKIFCSGDTA